jgi:hypothetical protein
MSLLGRGVAELAPLGPHKGARADTANLLGTAPQIGPAFHMCRERTDCKIHPMTCGSEGIGHTMPTTSEAAVHLGATRLTRHMNDARRGNYDSGEDFVLEYGELRFTFNERDFRERCEQAANKLGFVSGRLDEPELEDLVTLSVNGEIQEPASALGEHVNDCWPELVGPSDRSLVHWLRRLVFRSAWLDQRVKEGELDVEFDEDSHTFMYVQPDRDGEPVELAPEPSWGRVAYVPR